MPNFDKIELESLLQRIIEGLKPENVKSEYGYYASLYPKGVTEAYIAHAVRGSRKLHPKMETLVRSIIDLISIGKVFSMWINEEEQAGCMLSYALAMYDKRYCELFAQSLRHQDMEHEVNQNGYISKVIKKWGACRETAQILLARKENPGQSGEDIIADYLARYEGFSEYINAREDNDGRVAYVDSEGQSRITITEKGRTDLSGKSDTAQIINRIRETPSTDEIVKGPIGNPVWFSHRAIADLLDACYNLCGFNEREKQVFEQCVSELPEDINLCMMVVQGRIVINRINESTVVDLFYQGKGKYVLTVFASDMVLQKQNIPEEFISYTKQLYEEFRKAKKKK